MPAVSMCLHVCEVVCGLHLLLSLLIVANAAGDLLGILTYLVNYGYC